jgi:hypothetical protein
MFRFILNFFLFGILFYIIYLFFPDAFHTLVSWAQQSYEFLRDFFIQIAEKLHSGRGGTAVYPPQHALFVLSVGRLF